jgi:hypothetical protein
MNVKKTRRRGLNLLDFDLRQGKTQARWDA